MAKQASLTYSDEINDKLIKWMNETGYTIVQINGQRISSSPRVDRRPSRGCEVFVGKIPRDCYEDELFPVFQSVGQIHELRLMMMFSGTNRGYAFVMYERLQDAQRAVNTLDNYEIRRGHRIGVLPCVNNCRLFVGCFEANERPEAQVQEVLRTETENVVSVSQRAGRSGRWYLLVEYSNHRAAAIARRELTPRRSQLFGPRVIVDWEMPLDKRGRKMALDQRRALKTSTMLKLYKPIADPQFALAKVDKKMHNYLENKSNHRPSASHLQAVSQSSSYEEQWLENHASSHDLFISPTDAVLYQNALNMSSSRGPDRYSNGLIIQRPLTASENGFRSQPGIYEDNGCQNQDIEHGNCYPYVYRQLVSGSQHSLMRSTGSSLYSDPDCQRPLSSDSSTGSTRSSCSLSGSSYLSVSNWDCNNNSVSVGNPSSISWERRVSNDNVDSRHSDNRLKKILHNDLKLSEYQSPSTLWHLEDQSSPCMDPNDKKLGIWTSCLLAQDDELIDNLFMKEDRSLNSSNFSYRDFNGQFEGLSLHNVGCSPQPNQPNYIGGPKRSPCSATAGKLFS